MFRIILYYFYLRIYNWQRCVVWAAINRWLISLTTKASPRQMNFPSQEKVLAWLVTSYAGISWHPMSGRCFPRQNEEEPISSRPLGADEIPAWSYIDSTNVRAISTFTIVRMWLFERQGYFRRGVENQKYPKLHYNSYNMTFITLQQHRISCTRWSGCNVTLVLPYHTYRFGSNSSRLITLAWEPSCL